MMMEKQTKRYAMLINIYQWVPRNLLQVSCIELVCVRKQIVYVMQFKLLNTYRMIGIIGDLRTVDDDFRNWIRNRKLLEL